MTDDVLSVGGLLEWFAPVAPRWGRKIIAQGKGAQRLPPWVNRLTNQEKREIFILLAHYPGRCSFLARLGLFS